MSITHERRGSRRKRWRIRVIPVPPERYPAFQHDPEHAFTSMAREKRVAEIDAVCARLWATRDVDLVFRPATPVTAAA
jgi:hypothetical protein